MSTGRLEGDVDVAKKLPLACGTAALKLSCATGFSPENQEQENTEVGIFHDNNEFLFVLFRGTLLQSI